MINSCSYSKILAVAVCAIPGNFDEKCGETTAHQEQGDEKRAQKLIVPADQVNMAMSESDEQTAHQKTHTS